MMSRNKDLSWEFDQIQKFLKISQ